MLEIRKNRFAKPYENEFFRVLARKLTVVFDDLKINGVLIGSPICNLSDNLQLDALLISEMAITIIDFKKYEGKLQLPTHSSFAWHKQPWKINEVTIVKGGSHANPFSQLEWQSSKLNNILLENVKSKLNSTENIEVNDTKKIVCFQREISLLNEIDPIYSHNFFIADPNSIVNCVADMIDVTPNEWKGVIRGNKLSQNAFDLIKKIFLADSFNPFRDNQLSEDFEQIKYPENEIRNNPSFV